MSQPNDASSSSFDLVVLEYLKGLTGGQAPQREELLRQHPQLADKLQSFFDMRDQQPPAVDADSLTLEHPRAARPREEAPPSPKATKPPSAPALAPGQSFGDYLLIEEVARGGMGVVYKARQRKANRVVALKMILSGQLAGEREVQRFHVEAQAAANLDHPGIVPVYDVGEVDGQHYFSMGFIDGRNLKQYLKENKLSPHEKAALLKEVAEAIAYAHGKGTVHRDLKPANVLIGREGRPHVTDFGLAKQLDADSELTASGQVIGTPQYMAPEQAAGKNDQVGPAADVYALGAVLYEMLTGAPPFIAENALDLLFRVLEEEPAPLRQFAPDVPADLEAICLKCLEKAPERRYATAAELAADLDLFLRGEPTQARPPGLWRRLAQWARQNPFLAVIYAMVPLFYVLYLTTTQIMGQQKAVAFHWALTGVVVVLLLTASTAQRLLQSEQYRTIGGYLLGALNVVALTGLFATDQGPRSTPISLYLVIIGLAAVMGKSTALVWFVTGLSMLCYAVLVVFDRAWAGQPVSLEQAISFLLVQGAMGLLFHLVLRRVRSSEAREAKGRSTTVAGE
jgi:serine/threonine-protein kinase